jgi:hypothetical protein
MKMQLMNQNSLVGGYAVLKLNFWGLVSGRGAACEFLWECGEFLCLHENR